jgi:uncharacterized protein YbjT (DUF2867 family)
MHVVLGATGHVGSAVADELLRRGEPVTVVTRDPRRTEPHAARGATVAVVDAEDVDALGALFRRARSAFVLLPPAEPATDTVAVEQRRVTSIVRALEGSTIERAVVQSTYGAQTGQGIGDLGVLYDLEQRVLALGLRTSIVRGAYYMSNWDASLTSARDAGEVPSFLPAGFALPMVAPADLGRVAARLLTDDAGHTGLHYVEGPTTYSAADVARAFAVALAREVHVVETPRAALEATFRALGFSAAAAASYARMTELTIDSGGERPASPERGSVTLADYVAALVGREAKAEEALAVGANVATLDPRW